MIGAGINLIPRTHKRRRKNFAKEDKIIVAIFLAVATMLGITYGYVALLTGRETIALTNLKTNVLRLDEEQKLLDKNRALRERSDLIEINISTALSSQTDINIILDDIAKNLPSTTNLTSMKIAPLEKKLEVSFADVKFINLVRAFGAFSLDKKFSSVSIDSYSIPAEVSTAAMVGSASTVTKANMTLMMTWNGGGS